MSSVILVLIVAKCNVNTVFIWLLPVLLSVLIVAKCNVNYDIVLKIFDSNIGINSSKV